MRHVVFGVISALAIAAASPVSSTAKPPITSAFTKIDDRCRQLTERKDEYVVVRCPGVSGVPLFVQAGDNRYDISAGVNDDGESFCSAPACAFDFPGDTVEWRLSGGKPFAIIYRLIFDPEYWPESKLKKSSKLMVETVGTNACRIAEIPGDTPNANAAARKAADLVLAGRTRCIDLRSGDVGRQVNKGAGSELRD